MNTHSSPEVKAIEAKKTHLQCSLSPESWLLGCRGPSCARACVNKAQVSSASSHRGVLMNSNAIDLKVKAVVSFEWFCQYLKEFM